MATIDVSCLFRYLPLKPENLQSIKESGGDVSDLEWIAHHAKRIIKNDPEEKFNGIFFHNGKTVDKKKPASTNVFLNDICRSCADEIRRTVGTMVIIVPVPNSSAVIGSEEIFRTLSLAKGIAHYMGSGVQAVPLLKWKRKKPRAHYGGSHLESHEVYNLLDVDKKLLDGHNMKVILFDDVLTKGKQRFACIRKLNEIGFQSIYHFSFLETIKYPDRADRAAWKTTTREQFSIEDFLPQSEGIFS